MNRFLSLLALATGLVAAQAATAPGPVSFELTDPVAGGYEGKWKTEKAGGDLSAQIRSLGDGAYDGFILLKQNGTNYAVSKLTADKGDLTLMEFTTSKIQDKAVASLADVALTVQIQKGKFAGTLEGDGGKGLFTAKKVKKKSSTLGAKPPKGAVLVFNGKDHGAFREMKWEIVDGVLQVSKGDLVAKDQYNDFELHIEFRVPHMPKARGQARANSGVYLQSIYEVQVLDSFGLFPLQINDCGSIYAIQPAPGNACLPPTEWQTYDIVLRNGGPGQTPTITVRHNNVLTIDRVKVPQNIVGKGGGGGTSGGGFLKLQDHGNPVQFRNIWVVPLK